MLPFRAAFVAALFYLFSAVSLGAQDVTLTSRDGSVVIDGALVGYDGEFFRLDTTYGILTVDGSGVICTGPGCPDMASYTAQIRISGSLAAGSTLLPELIGAFANHQNYKIDRSVTDDSRFVLTLIDPEARQIVANFKFNLSNSDEGFADLLAEEADIVISAREVSEQEASRGQEAGIGNLHALNQSRVIALDALVPIVSKMNPVDAISPTNLYRIFSGGITNWQELGGLDAPIELHMGEVSLGQSRVFEADITQADFKISDAVRRHQTLQDLADVIARDPLSIGITALSETANTKGLTLSGSCDFHSVAKPEALRTEDYPFTAPIFLYLSHRRLPAIAREFLRFIRSDHAREAIERAGFAAQNFSEIPVSRQGDRLANSIRAAGNEISLAELQRMVSVLVGAARLSVSFRFEGGSSRLDAQSRSNIVLIARALESGTFDERQMTFVGFSDGLGQADANKQLAQERASAVRSAILREASTVDPSRISLGIETFGEAMPMACDDTEWGRQVNRRVEVWVR